MKNKPHKCPKTCPCPQPCKDCAEFGEKKPKIIKGWAVINKDCLDDTKREIGKNLWWGDLFFSENKAKERASQSKELIKVPCGIKLLK